jgi:dephospho-CoA kinase
LLKVALTGNIASGKSTVARVWRDLGAPVIDADDLARRIVGPGTAALVRIVDRWGPGILLPSGELDRAALRDVIFRDPVERKRLEEIVHPEVDRLRRKELEFAAREGRPIVVSDIPLLFEVGLEGEFDVVVLVDAPEEVRRQRLIRDRGLGSDEAARMLEAQWPTDRKRPRSDYVVENAGSKTELEARAREVWFDLLARVGGAPDRR